MTEFEIKNNDEINLKINDDIDPIKTIDKPKKKRGRKPKQTTNDTEKPLPKKRGRKPKKKVESEEPRLPKKRGRKPKGKVISYTKNVGIQSVDSICSNIITNLPVKMEELSTDDDSQLSSNSDDEIQNIFTTNNEITGNTINLFTLSDTPNEENNDVANTDCKCDQYKKKIKELNNVINNMSVALSESNSSLKERRVYMMKTNFINLDDNQQELAESTDIYCWWCCHPFDNPPCQLPEKYYEKKYHVFGCFCSYNCALAYNLDLDDYKTNERTTLLAYLYSEIYGKNIKLEAALPKKALKIFGGPFTIDKFREHSINNEKEFRFIMPPMISIVPLIEEDYKDKNKNSYKTNKYIPLNDKKLSMANENLKLKRSVPLPNSKYSLENTMGLRRRKDNK